MCRAQGLVFNRLVPRLLVIRETKLRPIPCRCTIIWLVLAKTILLGHFPLPHQFPPHIPTNLAPSHTLCDLIRPRPRQLSCRPPSIESFSQRKPFTLTDHLGVPQTLVSERTWHFICLLDHGFVFTVIESRTNRRFCLRQVVSSRTSRICVLWSLG